MRPASSGLIAFLLSRQPFWTTDLFSFALTNGTTNNWTSSDQSITAGGTLYVAMGPALTRTKWSVKNTIEVPEMEIKMLSTGTDYNSGENIKLLIHNGLLDGATITLYRAFMPTFGNTSYGQVLLFQGKTSTISLGAIGATITVKGINVCLQQYMPRNLFQLSCIHSLYDSGCTKDRADYTFEGVVGVAPTAQLITWGTHRTTDGSDFRLGYITMTSGVANGQSRTIEAANNSQMYLAYPLYEAPSVGDTFTATYGCDRSLTTCGNVFSNTAHYRGFPYIPPAETAY
jgi:uncharacterized phage protein (TIGR02218 family)